MCSKDSIPKSGVSPLVRFVGARDYTYGYRYVVRDDMFLLFAQCYSWCEEPGKLTKKGKLGVISASREWYAPWWAPVPSHVSDEEQLCGFYPNRYQVRWWCCCVNSRLTSPAGTLLWPACQTQVGRYHPWITMAWTGYGRLTLRGGSTWAKNRVYRGLIYPFFMDFAGA